MYTRKQVLGAGALGVIGALGGCIDPEPSEISVGAHNRHSQSHTVAITVTRFDDNAVVDGTVTVGPSESEDVGSFDAHETDGEQKYTMTAELDGDEQVERTFSAGGATGTAFLQAVIDRDGEFDIELGKV